MQTQVSIPAGIGQMDKRSELYISDNKLFGTYKGKSMAFHELPPHIRDYYVREYFDDVEAQRSIKDDMGIIGFQRALYTYIKCNHGGFDFDPDFDATGVVKNEYWNCGKRFQCAAEGKVCKPWIMTNHGLSIREIEVIKHIADGQPDKVIADKMFLAATTIQTHSRTIKKKLNLHTKSEVTRFAKENNIL